MLAPHPVRLAERIVIFGQGTKNVFLLAKYLVLFWPLVPLFALLRKKYKVMGLAV